jgi:hypothetical protein
MLEPQDRRLLFEALRPPTGYELDVAVGTTYSLDLLTLLTAPLGFTLFDWQEREGRPTADPVALLEAIRRNAERMAIFCEAGRISVPRKHHQLFGYLEGSVVEVTSPNPGGVFHPKLWVLRMLGPDGHVRYRLMCLSRNLTPDRSWDVTLVLDGELLDRKVGISANHPLADFVAALPTLAVNPVSESVQRQAQVVSEDLRKVEFELPAGFDEYVFWPLGIPKYKRWPFPSDADCGVVISPFLSAETVSRLGRECQGVALVSRAEELMKLPAESLAPFDEVYTLAPAAEAEAESDEVVESGEGLTGLHAKVYVVDHGWRASVWVGSANATRSAFERNVEFLVELVGQKKGCGTAALLGHGTGAAGFLDLLQPYTPGPPVATDPIAERLEEMLESARVELARGKLAAKIDPAPGGLFSLRLVRGVSTPIALPDGVTAWTWPLSLHRDSGARQPNVQGDPVVADFGAVALLSLTGLFGFAIQARHEGAEAECEFVLNLPLLGAPESRREAILRSLLDDRGKVLRFLLFLLDLEKGSAIGDDTFLNGGGNGGTPPYGPAGDAVPLLEALLRALDRDPKRLDQVAALVKDLSATPEGQRLLPERFMDVWPSIWEARQTLL